MLDSERRHNCTHTTIAPLVLPHEFYCRNRDNSVQDERFRWSVSDQLTISFAQKKVNKASHDNQTTERNQVSKKDRNKKTLHNLRDRKIRCPSDSFKQHRPLHLTNNLTNYERPQAPCNCEIVSSNDEVNDEVTKSIQTAEICDLVNDIKTMLQSDMFVNELLEQNLLEEASNDLDKRQWRDHFEKFVLPSIRENGKDILLTYDKFERIQIRRRENLISKAFWSWRQLTVRFMKKDIIEQVDSMDAVYYHSKKRDIFQVVSSLSLETSSRKKILQRRKDGLASARSSLILTLSKKNEAKGIITNQMVQKELRKIFHAELFNWNRERYKEMCFSAWKLIFEKTKQSELSAYRYLRIKIFKKWRIWKNNQIKVTTGDCQDRYAKFVQAEALCERLVRQKTLRAWRTKASAYVEATRMQRRVLTTFVRNTMKDWLRITKQCRTIKLNVLKEWMDYQHFILGRPFLCWREITASLRQRRRDQIFFLASYKKVKRRNMQWNIFRFWRHQARYGRITSMYTRQDLLRILDAQKNTIDQLKLQINDNNE